MFEKVYSRQETQDSKLCIFDLFAHIMNNKKLSVDGERDPGKNLVGEGFSNEGVFSGGVSLGDIFPGGEVL